jgi:peptidoglycan/xylan/chitin deacetylase (PgdA/CDA1 family)
MLRRLRRLVLLAIVAVAAGAGALFLTTRPRLDDRRKAVDHAWSTVVPSIDQRAAKLFALDAAVIHVGGPKRDQSTAVESALTSWQHARTGNLSGAIVAANEMEGSGRRLLRLAQDPARRYRADAGVVRAVNDYVGSAAAVSTTAPDVNTAIQRYDDARGGMLHRVVADILGDGELPRLVVT